MPPAFVESTGPVAPADVAEIIPDLSLPAGPILLAGRPG